MDLGSMSCIRPIAPIISTFVKLSFLSMSVMRQI